MSKLRTEVLKCFKSLHRTRERIFKGDRTALREGRKKINTEFRKNRDIVDTAKINELLQLSKAVENELITTVIQAREIKPGVYHAEIRPEIVKIDNIPYKDCCK
ncbi:hypothetical protein FQA39_LY16672 [Lamprigera yunnana]|nr:hypothetical protein FQA39_LY16672 [Lamprigera yunnana]